jgi:hypothetical protein
LHRRAEEATNNEILAFLTIVLGAVFLVGGLVETVVVAESPRWFLVVPYQNSSNPSMVLGFILMVLGFMLISAGFVLSIHYDRKKEWYLNQLEESSVPDIERERHRRLSRLNRG